MNDPNAPSTVKEKGTFNRSNRRRTVGGMQKAFCGLPPECLYAFIFMFSLHLFAPIALAWKQFCGDRGGCGVADAAASHSIVASVFPPLRPVREKCFTRDTRSAVSPYVWLYYCTVHPNSWTGRHDCLSQPEDKGMPSSKVRQRLLSVAASVPLTHLSQSHLVFN